MINHPWNTELVPTELLEALKVELEAARDEGLFELSARFREDPVHLRMIEILSEILAERRDAA